ncbi:iron-containing alcohol dehydrogenase [Fusobacterium sp. PH5-44]|uniref:iron-containing alcohol dehydrogenase n=1 Tax=unclassified Fusobacterium TaxID=2648384 RepID=UPI003D217784
MINFKFYNPAKIIFGKKTEDKIGIEIKSLEKSRVLLVYGGGSIKKSGLYDTVINKLKEENISCWELSGVLPNPRLSLVREGIKLCRENNIDFILAVGGGSVIDTAKGISLGVNYNGDVWDLFVGKGKHANLLPIGVILTIAAAGSETSDSCVITNEDGLEKKSYNTIDQIPKFAIMNPEFTYTLPEYQTACGCSDILAHLMERYFTQTTHVDFTDRLLEASMRTIIDYAPMVMENPDNYDYRAEIMWAGSLAHNGLLNTGRIGDWGSHRIEHELSGIYDIAHGAGLSIIFPAWMKYVYKENIDRFVQFAVKVFDVNLPMENKEEIILEGIKRLERFFRIIKLPVYLNEVNISDKHFKEMAEKACKYGPVGQFKKLYGEDVEAIYNLAK